MIHGTVRKILFLDHDRWLALFLQADRPTPTHLSPFFGREACGPSQSRPRQTCGQKLAPDQTEKMTCGKPPPPHHPSNTTTTPQNTTPKIPTRFFRGSASRSDCTLNVIPSLGGRVLMPLTDGGMQYLIGGASN